MAKFRDDPSDELRNGRSCCGLHCHAMAIQQLDVDGSLSCAVVGPVAIVMVREFSSHRCAQSPELCSGRPRTFVIHDATPRKLSDLRVMNSAHVLRSPLLLRNQLAPAYLRPGVGLSTAPHLD